LSKTLSGLLTLLRFTEIL